MMETNSDLLKRISELENENEALKKWQGSVNQLLQQMLDMVSAQNSDNSKIREELANLKTFASINRYRINSLPYELQDPDYKSFFFKPKILSRHDTRRLIIDEHRSMARLGDGEFAAIVGQKRWNFQDESELLAVKMQEVLRCEDDGLLIGLNPSFYRNLFDMDEDDADGVRAYMHPMVRRLHAQLLDPEKQYADALFHNIDDENDVNELKQIWDGRECVFIEGINTRMGVGNDLFDNCDSIERILGPSENAIDRFDDLMNEACKHPKDKLILIALGPTATVLAYELFKEGYQALDIGHIDLLYESFVRNTDNLYSVDIPYKYCSRDEKIAGRIIEDVDDPVYKSQIIRIIQ